MNKTSTIKRKRPKSKSDHILFIVVIVLAVAVVITGAFVFLTTREKKYTVKDANGVQQRLTLDEMQAVLDVDTIYPGIFVNGVDLSDKTKKQAADLFAKDKSLDVPKVDITLTVKDQKFSLTAPDINFSSNLVAVIDQAYNIGRTSTLDTEETAIVERYTTWLNLKVQPEKLKTAYTADEATVSNVVHGLLDPLKVEAVDAKATSFDKDNLTFVYEDAKEGQQVDVEGAIKEVMAALKDTKYNQDITVSTSVVEPKITKDILASTLGKISSTTTETTQYDPTSPNRNNNIDLIAQALNGLVLQPGESFSFNSYIGQRTAEKGYKTAGGIFDGTTRQELGGGICQTNTTLFHSLVKSDIQIDFRQAHSWPSKYVNPGTDATVSWEWPDFEFTNNTDYPLAIHAYYGDYHVTVEIFGRPVADGMTIAFEGKIIDQKPPEGPEYVADPTLPIGKTVQERAPHDYILAEAYKIYLKDGTEVRRDLAYTTTYNPIREKIKVGVLGPDGVVYPMDPATGAVASPAPTEAPPVVTDAPVATEAPPATEPSEANAPAPAGG